MVSLFTLSANPSATIVGGVFVTFVYVDPSVLTQRRIDRWDRQATQQLNSKTAPPTADDDGDGGDDDDGDDADDGDDGDGDGDNDGDDLLTMMKRLTPTQHRQATQLKDRIPHRTPLILEDSTAAPANPFPELPPPCPSPRPPPCLPQWLSIHSLAFIKPGSMNNWQCYHYQDLTCGN